MDCDIPSKGGRWPGLCQAAPRPCTAMEGPPGLPACPQWSMSHQSWWQRQPWGFLQAPPLPPARPVPARPDCRCTRGLGWLRGDRARDQQRAHLPCPFSSGGRRLLETLSTQLGCPCTAPSWAPQCTAPGCLLHSACLDGDSSWVRGRFGSPPPPIPSPIPSPIPKARESAECLIQPRSCVRSCWAA